jgi:hypothetical protein
MQYAGNAEVARDTTRDTTPRLTKCGLTVFDKPMTYRQAVRWGEKNIPPELKRVRFGVSVYRATVAINGWDGYRINFGAR